MYFLFEDPIIEDKWKHNSTEKANLYVLVYAKSNKENITRRSCVSACDLGVDGYNFEQILQN